MKITSANPTVSESMPITQKGASAESKALLKASNIEKALAILGCLKEQALKRYVWLYNHHIPQKALHHQLPIVAHYPPMAMR